jgi:endo-1,4-beta-xylanase
MHAFRRLMGLALLMALPGLAWAASQGRMLLIEDAASTMELVGQRTSAVQLSKAMLPSGAPQALSPSGTVLGMVCTAPFDNKWDAQVRVRIPGPIESGEVLLVGVWMRCTRSLHESGDGRTQAVIELGKDPWTKILEQDMRVPGAWQKFYLRLKSRQAYAAGEAQLLFRLGYDTQTLELAGLSLQSFGTQARLEDLPVTKVTYSGMEANAPWRAAAWKRIEQLRTAGVTITVKDAQGRSVPGAKVQVRMQRSAFNWGTAISGQQLMAWGYGKGSERYDKEVCRLFNMATEENAFKWKPLAGDWGATFSADTAIQSHAWAKERGLRFRGHVLAWPSWRNMPDKLKQLENDKPALREAQIEHIHDTMGLIAGNADQWDVLNEPFDNHDLMDLLGKAEPALWFREARKADPKARLYINDYAILEGGGGTNGHRDFYEQFIKDLQAAKAPLDASDCRAILARASLGPKTCSNAWTALALLACPCPSPSMTLKFKTRPWPRPSPATCSSRSTAMPLWRA